MATIGVLEVNTQLPDLLARVQNGEQITIIDQGIPVAMLVPAPPSAQSKRDIREVIAELKELRKGRTLPDGMTIRDMIEEGRRF